MQEKVSPVFLKTFGFNEDILPRGISYGDLLKTPAFLQSFPCAFTYSTPSKEVMTEAQMYKSLLAFISANKGHKKHLEQLLFPFFCFSIMKFKEKSEYDQLEKYVSEFVKTIPTDMREKADRFISDEVVFQKYASLFSTQRFKVAVTPIEAELINNFLNEQRNSQLRYRITDLVILTPITEKTQTEETRCMFAPLEAVKDISIYQTKIPGATVAAMSAATHHIYASFDNSRVSRFSTEDGKAEVIAKHPAAITSISVSSRGSMVVSTDMGGEFNLWTENASFNGRIIKDPMICSAFAPQGGVFCVGCGDLCTYMYDASRASKIRTFVGHTKPVTSVKFHPNCAYIGTSSQDCTVRIWDVRKGATARLFISDTDSMTKFTSCVNFSPDGKYVTYYDGKVRVADIGSGNDITARECGLISVKSLFFAEDSKSVFIVNKKGDIKVLEFLSEDPIKDVISLNSDVVSASINKMNEISIITSSDNC
jgi:hypothetical protein